VTDGVVTTGTLATALAHGSRLLASDPAMAEAQAREILGAYPGHPEALLLLAASQRVQGRPEAAVETLEPVVRALPAWPPGHLEVGLAMAELGHGKTAAAALRRATALEPRLIPAWRALAEQLRALGDDAGADAATAAEIRASTSDPGLLEAATALVDNRLAVAERLLRDRLKRDPENVPAIRMLAEVGGRLGKLEDAEKLLSRALELAPGFAPARFNYATVLYRLNRAAEAVAHLDLLLAREPGRAGYMNLKAAALGRIGEYDQAIALYDVLLARYPDHPKAWMSYGHALKTVGRQEDCVAAYRRAVALSPQLGEAWWSLANLKTWSFAPADIAAMREQLARPDLSDEDRLHLEYALGKATEDAGAWDESFGHYARGAALRRGQVTYDPDGTSAHLERSRAVFTPAFFGERVGWGCPAADPIFVVGLPRAGSTLIEQILSSHSAVEGTMELPDVITIARRLGGSEGRRSDSLYPEVLQDLGASAVAALGEEYLERTRVQRKTDRPFFIDKMPNNFAHLGLICLMLPNAKIVDARRHPMAGCFSAFKQHFARGQHFSYDLVDLGRYYADYVALMAHFDAVLPGRVHRVIYEDMVADPEARIRDLLDYCGLPFEEACLRFHENARAVRTASSEQVRRPIFTEALDHWRRYEAHLDPLRSALGPALDRWRG